MESGLSLRDSVSVSVWSSGYLRGVAAERSGDRRFAVAFDSTPPFTWIDIFLFTPQGENGEQTEQVQDWSK